MRIVQLPALQDNYAYIIITNTNQAIIVDTPDSAIIMDYCSANNIPIIGILNTHHHSDHIGGNNDIINQYKCPVYGFDQRINGLTNQVKENDKFILGAIEWQVIYTPGHTLGHVCYYAGQLGAVFVGDALFAMGCGRLFEGTPAQAWESMGKLRQLPAETLVYCAHEYTLSNTKFVAHLGENNPIIDQRIAHFTHQRALGQPTIPTTIGWEQQTNPFMRCDDKNLQQLCNIYNEIALYGHLRQLKNTGQF